MKTTETKKTETKSKPRTLGLAELTGVVGGMEGDPIIIGGGVAPGPIVDRPPPVPTTLPGG